MERGEGGRNGDSEYELVTTWTPPAFTVGQSHMQPQHAHPGLGSVRPLRCSVGQRELQRGWRQGGMGQAEATCTAVSVGRRAAAEKPATWDRTQLNWTNKEVLKREWGAVP